jgi:uncharacterized protein YdcH (DUF465 family)
MAGTTEDRKRRLEQSPRLRRLAERHDALERRLAELRAQRWISDEERLEEARLKKQKLALKDEIEASLQSIAD